MGQSQGIELSDNVIVDNNGVIFVEGRIPETGMGGLYLESSTDVWVSNTRILRNSRYGVYGAAQGTGSASVILSVDPGSPT